MRFFLLERYYGNKRGIEKIAPIEVKQKIVYIQSSQNFVEDISTLLSSAENIKNITHWMKMNCFNAYLTEKRTTSSVEELIG